ncbi:MAG: DMT family transporter [Alistipes sp.]|nr:DMT family transporter [Alistipes sp.]
MNPKAQGYLIGALAAAAYGTNPLFALPLYDAGMDPDSVLLFRYLFAIPLLGAMLWFRGRSLRVPRRDVPLLFAMGILVALSSLTLFLSYNYMDAGIASTLLFVYPILVALIMAVGFKERFTLTTGLCILLACGGIGLLYRSGDGSTLSLAGTLLVFVSALSYAIYIVAVRVSRLREIPTLAVTFYVLLFGLLLFVFRVDFGQALILPDRWHLWGNLLALALFPTAISFLCTTRAINLIGSTPTAILGALEPVTAVFFGVAVFGETLTLRIGCGIVLIIVAVMLIIAGNNLSPTLTHFRRLFPRLPRRNH